MNIVISTFIGSLSTLRCFHLSITNTLKSLHVQSDEFKILSIRENQYAKEDSNQSA